MPVSVPQRPSRGLSRAMAAAFALVIILITGTFGALVLNIRGQHDDAQNALRAERILGESNAAERDLVDIETGLRGYLLTGEAEYLEPYEAGRLHYAAHLETMRMLVTDAAQRTRLTKLRRDSDAYVEAYAVSLRATRGGIDLKDEIADGKRDLDLLRAQFDTFNQAEVALANARRERTAASSSRSVLLAAAGATGSALVLILLAIYLQRSILVPVRRVAVAARRLATGRRDARVPLGGRGEIALLGESFNGMADSLTAREEELRVASDRLDGILGHATAMISVKDVDGRYLLVGRRWQEETGLSAEAVLGRTDAELLPGRHAAPSRAADLQVIRTGELLEFEREASTAFASARLRSDTSVAIVASAYTSPAASLSGNLTVR